MKTNFVSAEIPALLAQLEAFFGKAQLVPITGCDCECEGLDVQYLLNKEPAACQFSRIIVVDNEAMVLRVESPLCESAQSEESMTAREQQIYQDDLIRDFLTGTYNRRYWETVFCKNLATQHAAGKSVAVALVSIDHFSELEQQYGAPHADQLICYVANQWKKFYDEHDEKVVCRLSKSTFVVGCVGADEIDLESQMRFLYEKMNLVCTSTCGMLCRIPFTLSVACSALSEVKEPSWQELSTLCEARLRTLVREGGNGVAFAELK